MRKPIVAILFFAAVATARAEGEGVARRPSLLHFRLAVGDTPARIVPGVLLVHPGPAVIGALLDLDGDGTFEKRIRCGTEAGCEICFQTDGRGYQVDFSLADAGGGAKWWFNWTLTQEDVAVSLIDGQTWLWPTAEEAAMVEPIRLGPPFRYEISPGTRGPDALIAVELKDGNGCTLRYASVGGEERRIHARLLSEGAVVFESDLTYG